MTTMSDRNDPLIDVLAEAQLSIECETWRPDIEAGAEKLTAAIESHQGIVWLPGDPVPDPPHCDTYIACPTVMRSECHAVQRCLGEDETMG